jgi:hypothetical protein
MRVYSKGKRVKRSLARIPVLHRTDRGLPSTISQHMNTGTPPSPIHGDASMATLRTTNLVSLTTLSPFLPQRGPTVNKRRQDLFSHHLVSRVCSPTISSAVSLFLPSLVECNKPTSPTRPSMRRCTTLVDTTSDRQDSSEVVGGCVG